MKKLLAIVAIAIVLSGCGSVIGRKDNTKYVDVIKPIKGLEALMPIVNGPDNIKYFAKAVFKIDTDFQFFTTSGTGFFVSQNGLFFTNYHVLGLPQLNQYPCRTDGCEVTLSMEYQQGSAPITKKVFVLPLFISSSLDLAIYQTYEDKDSLTKFIPPGFLKLKNQSFEEISQKNLSMIGHPLGALKKYSVGSVVGQDGRWFITNNFGFSGNSGSPFVDDDGYVAGILHRGPSDDLSLVSASGINNFSVGSPIYEIFIALQDVPHLSINASSGELEFHEDKGNTLYVTALEPKEVPVIENPSNSPPQQPEPSLTGIESMRQSISDCHENLSNLKDIVSSHAITMIEEFDSTKFRCKEAMNIDFCKSENFDEECLESAQFNGTEIFNEYTELYYGYKGRVDMNFAKSYSNYSLLRDNGFVEQENSEFLKQVSFLKVLEKYSMAPNFLESAEILSYLEIFDPYQRPMLGGIDLIDSVLDYKLNVSYQFLQDSVVGAINRLYSKGFLERAYPSNFGEVYVTKLNEILDDPNFSFILKLKVEVNLYDFVNKL